MYETLCTKRRDMDVSTDSVSESDNDLESESETSGPEDDALPMGSGDDSRDGEHSTPMPTQQDLMAMYPVLLNEPKMPTPGSTHLQILLCG